jgi:hypothetical protein
MSDKRYRNVYVFLAIAYVCGWIIAIKVMK